MDFGRIIQLFSYFGVFLLLIFRNDKNPIKFPKYLLFYLLFTVYVFYSDLYRLNREFKVMYLFSNRLIGGFLIMLIIENLLIPKEYFTYMVKTSKYILIVAIVTIVVQQVYSASFFINPSMFDDENTVLSKSGNTDRLMSIYSWIGGMALGFGFIPIFLLIIEKMVIERKKIIIWIIAGLVFVFLSKARWVIVNFLLVFFVIYVHNKGRFIQLIRYFFILPFLLVLSFFVLNFTGIDASGILKERILESNKKDMNHRSAGTRILAFKAFDKLYWENPINGTGNIRYGMGGVDKQPYKLRSFLKGRSSQMHVGYLSLLYLYGMVGGILFLSFLFLLLRKLYQNAKLNGMWASFFGFLGFAIANLTLVTFSVFQMGLIITLIANRYYSQNLKYNQERLA